MTLTELRSALETQALDYLAKAQAATDEKLRAGLQARAEQSAKYAATLDPYLAKRNLA